ncbi:MAG: type II toxin-antitoxin system HicB family antitoxin [Advenella sp.]
MTTTAIAPPSSFEDWCNDEQFQDGCWMLVDIDLSRIDTKAVRLNISLPLRKRK